MKLDEQSKPYFIDHNTKQSTYNDPRAARANNIPPPAAASKNIYVEEGDGLC